MDYTRLDDETLMRLITHEQAEALGALYDRYGRLVFSVAFNAVGSPSTAEEVTQDVFLRVWQKAHTYHADQGKVSTWLSSIARNRAIDVLRQQRVRPEQRSVEWAEVRPAALPQIEGPEEEVALAIEQQRVRAAVAQLPEEQQQTLALAYFQGLSHSEIAVALGQPLGTVKTRIRLAMAKLRQLLSSPG
jgi:RNA polymerase sigma-70 factor (ECF subfamily)